MQVICCDFHDLPHPPGVEADDYLGRWLVSQASAEYEEQRREYEAEQREHEERLDLADRLAGRCECCREFNGSLELDGSLAVCVDCMAACEPGSADA